MIPGSVELDDDEVVLGDGLGEVGGVECDDEGRLGHRLRVGIRLLRFSVVALRCGGRKGGGEHQEGEEGRRDPRTRNGHRR